MSDRAQGMVASRLQSFIYESRFLDTIRTGILVQDAASGVIEYNPAAVRLLGLDEADWNDGQDFDPWNGAVREDGSPYQRDELPTTLTLRTGQTYLDVVVGLDLPGQVRRWLSVDTYQLTVSDDVVGVVAAFDDIDTQWHERRLLKLLAEVNRVVMSTSDEAETLNHLCATLVDEGFCALAWIGVADRDDETLRVRASAGSTGALHTVMSPGAEMRITGLGPSGTAIRTDTVQVANDLLTDPGFLQWNDVATRFGLRSYLGIPFMIGHHRGGLFVYSTVTDAFDEATVRGLQQIAKEVGFGVAYVRSVRESEEALEAKIAANDARRATEHALSESEKRFQLAFEHNMAPMSFSDSNDRMIAVNDALCVMIGYAGDELVGEDMTHFTLPEDQHVTADALRRMQSGEVDHLRYVQRFLRKDGRIIVSEVSRSAARDAGGDVRYYVLSERDVTEERKLTDQLSHQAFHDPLTGLANRALFDDRLVQAHARIIRQKGVGAVLLLDLDDFKGVNDTHGHLVGDQLLIGVARRLEMATRGTDTLCRFGGDEFLYLAEELSTPWDAEEVARRLLDSLATPFSFGGLSLVQHASVGIVLLDQTSKDSSECVQAADVALYEAKRQHRGGYAWFTPTMQQRVASSFTLVQELRHALHAGELSMHFQPIVELESGAIVGVEALMRWLHPDRGWVPPASFIPLAERSDLIVDLGAFALHEAATAAASWSGPDGAAGPFVTVNLSAHQFFDGNLMSMIEEVLASSGLAPERLVFEITEGVALLDTAETLSAIEHLNRLGIGIALDDFGTGYSSLSHLAMLQPRIIKIDQSFVRPAHAGEQSELLLETIVSLGDKLHMTMLAEGIETNEQLTRLVRAGCELGQGYLFSPAVPANELELLLERREPLLDVRRSEGVGPST